MVHQLGDNGAAFISYSEPHFRTTGPAGSLMLAIAAWIAEQEKRRISERTKAGLATARAKGKMLGRRPVHAGIGAAVQRHHAAGLSIAKITKALAAEGVTCSRETVRRALKLPFFGV